MNILETESTPDTPCTHARHAPSRFPAANTDRGRCDITVSNDLPYVKDTVGITKATCITALKHLYKPMYQTACGGYTRGNFCPTLPRDRNFIDTRHVYV